MTALSPSLSWPGHGGWWLYFGQPQTHQANVSAYCFSCYYVRLKASGPQLLSIRSRQCLQSLEESKSGPGMFVYELHSHSWQCLFPICRRDRTVRRTQTSRRGQPPRQLHSVIHSPMESIHAICVRPSYLSIRSQPNINLPRLARRARTTNITLWESWGAEGRLFSNFILRNSRERHAGCPNWRS